MVRMACPWWCVSSPQETMRCKVRKMRPTPEECRLLPSCQGKCPASAQIWKWNRLQWISTTTQCQCVQMKSLNGFSNSLAWADSFTAESEIPRLGQIVSLPNPRCRMGFQLKPRLLTELFSQTQFSKMNSRYPFFPFNRPFIPSLVLFLH